MKRFFVAWLGLLALAGVGHGGRSAALSAGRAGLQSALQLDRLLSRHQRRRRLGQFAVGRDRQFDVSGGMVGGTVGYNWQIGQFVVGVEGDIDWAGIKGSTTCCAGRCKTRNTWLATVRGRLGYAFDRFLPYVTGGLRSATSARPPGFPGGSTTNAGWTVGAGVEFGIASNVSVKAEYLYVDLGNFNCGFDCGLRPRQRLSLRQICAAASTSGSDPLRRRTTSPGFRPGLFFLPAAR